MCLTVYEPFVFGKIVRFQLRMMFSLLLLDYPAYNPTVLLRKIKTLNSGTQILLIATGT